MRLEILVRSDAPKLLQVFYQRVFLERQRRG